MMYMYSTIKIHSINCKPLSHSLASSLRAGLGKVVCVTVSAKVSIASPCSPTGVCKIQHLYTTVLIFVIGDHIS